MGDYELEVQIGAGAAGTVWKARRRGPIVQVVALKRLRGALSTPTDLARMRREAAVLTALDHPHIVRVFEVLDDSDGLAVAMQFAPGGSFEALLAERPRLAPGEVVGVAAPIADALASAHRRSIVHADVKPANILFTSDGEPLLGDFGVARTLGRLTSDQITGTAHYLAPEVMDGAAPDARTDIYALAVVCYEALTGQLPYDGPVPLAVIRAADTGFHAPLAGHAGVPPALAEVVEQAMARDPSRRFASADAFARALRESVPHQDSRLPGTATATLPPVDDATRGTRDFGPRPPRAVLTPPPVRYRVPGAFFVLLILAGALYLMRGPLRPDDPDGPEDREDEPACPEMDRPVAGPGMQIVEGDPEGDGCDTFGDYQLQSLEDGEQRMLLTIQVDGREIRVGGLGHPGDQVFIGDWDCDGDDTPGLYQRAEGEVQYYNTWPTQSDEVYEPAATESVPPDSSASVTPGGDDDESAEDGAEGSEDGGEGGEDSGDGCDRITVT